MTYFKDNYMRNDENSPLRDRILRLRDGEEYAYVFRQTLLSVGLRTMAASLQDYDNARADEGIDFNRRYKEDNVLGTVDILIRALCTPTRSLSVASFDVLSLMVKHTNHKNDVFLGITALEATEIIEDLFSVNGDLYNDHRFFTHYIE